VIKEIEVVKTTVTATSRPLNVKWRICWPRKPMPTDLDFKSFTHNVSLPFSGSFEEAQIWLLCNIGPLDQGWTYQDSCSILFRQQHHAVQFSLTFA
jgi:hypothetical protein